MIAAQHIMTMRRGSRCGSRPLCERCRAHRPGQRVCCVFCCMLVGPGCDPPCLLAEFCRARTLRCRYGMCVHCSRFDPEVLQKCKNLLVQDTWDDPIRCEVCDSDIVDKIMDYPTKKQAAKKPATKTAVKTKAECGGSPDSDIVDNIMYYPTKKQAAKKPATKKAVKTKAEKTKAVKTKEAVKTKVATRLSAK